MADLPDSVTLEDLDRIANEQREVRSVEGYKYPEFLLQQNDGKPMILEVPGQDAAASTFYVVTADMDAKNSDFMLLEYNDLSDWRGNLWDTPNAFENTGEAIYRSSITGEALPADQVQEITVKIQQDGSAVVVSDSEQTQDYWTFTPNNPADDQNVNSFEADNFKLAHNAQLAEAQRQGNQTRIEELGEFPKDSEKGELRSVKIALVNIEGLDLSVGSIISQEQLQGHLLNSNEYNLVPKIVQTNAATQPSDADDRANVLETREAHGALRILSKQGVGEPSAMISADYVMSEARISFNGGPPVSFDPAQNAATIVAPVPTQAEPAAEKNVQPATAEEYLDAKTLQQIEKLEGIIGMLPAGHPGIALYEGQISELRGEAEPAPPPEPDTASSGTSRNIGDIEEQHEAEQAKLASQGVNPDGTVDYVPEPEYQNKPELMSAEQFAAGMNEVTKITRQELAERLETLDPNSAEYQQINAALEQAPEDVSPDDMAVYLRQAQDALPTDAYNLQDALNSGDVDRVIAELQSQMQPGDVAIQSAFSDAAGKGLSDPNLGLTTEQQEQVQQLLVEQYKGALSAVAEGRPLEQVVNDTGFDIENSSVDTSQWDKAQIRKVNEMAQDIITEAGPLIQEDIEQRKAVAINRLDELEASGVNVPDEIRERLESLKIP